MPCGYFLSVVIIAISTLMSTYAAMTSPCTASVVSKKDTMANPKTDEEKANPLFSYMCSTSCMCKALTMGLVSSEHAAKPESILKNIVRMSNPLDAGPFPIPNPVDAVCMALLESPSEELNKAMGNEKTALPSSGGYLGKDGECLSTCLRLSAFLQQNPESMSNCDAFADTVANQPSDPVNMLGHVAMNHVLPTQAGGALLPTQVRTALAFLSPHSFLEKDSSVFRGQGTRKGTSHVPSFVFPEAWRKLGLTPGNLERVSKTAKYYRENADEVSRSSGAV
eukprot:g506.t1